MKCPLPRPKALCAWRLLCRPLLTALKLQLGELGWVYQSELPLDLTLILSWAVPRLDRPLFGGVERGLPLVACKEKRQVSQVDKRDPYYLWEVR